MTAKTTLVDKVRKLDSSSQAVDKTIKINFTFKAKDTTLKNNTKTISIEVKLTKELAFKPSSLVGTWKNGDAHNFTVGEGNITSIKINNVTATKTITIDTWKEDKDKDVSEYTQSIKGDTVGNHTYDFVFTFKSASSCDVSSTEDNGTPVYYTLTKQPTTK